MQGDAGAAVRPLYVGPPPQALPAGASWSECTGLGTPCSRSCRDLRIHHPEICGRVCGNPEW